MALRLILGMVLTAALAGCFDGSSGSTVTAGSNGTATTAGTVSGSITSTGTSTESTVVPLVLSGVPAASATVGSAYSFTPTVASATGVVTFAVSGLPAWATFDSSTGTLSGTPSSAVAGSTGDITITATDGSSSGSVGPFVIRINPEPTTSGPPAPPSAPPVISGTPGTAVTSGQSYTFQPVAGDAAGNPLTFAITNCPGWATFSTATGRLTGTPTVAQAGSYPGITIRVTDGTLSAALPAFTLVVTAAAPDMPVIAGTAAASVVAGQPYSFQPSASDPAGKPLTFSITNPPVWGVFSTKTGKLSGTPSSTQIGSYVGIVITADNGTQMTSLPAFTVQVTAAPLADAPTIAGTPGTAVVAGHAYAFTPTAVDPAGKALTFSIVGRPSWAAFNTSTGALSGTPTSGQAGSYPGITISVTNGTATATLPAFGITVTAAAATNGSATLSWVAPTTNTDGTPLTDLAGYRIYYGNSSGSMTQTLQVPGPAVTTATISGLSSGTWYFQVLAYNRDNVDGAATAAASKTID